MTPAKQPEQNRVEDHSMIAIRAELMANGRTAYFAMG
jgi:hypothetical protein